MSVTRTKEEQALIDKIKHDIVVPGVLAPMAAIGWGQGTPPTREQLAAAIAEAEKNKPAGGGQPGTEGAPPAKPPAADGQPAATPTAKPKTDIPTIEELVASYEALRDPATGLIEGKYKTVQEAMKGRVHLNTMAKQAFSERDALLAKVTELEAQRMAPAAPPAAPAATQPTTTPTYNVPSKARVERAQSDYAAVLAKIEENGGVLSADTSKDLARVTNEMSAAQAEFVVEEREARQRAAQDAQDREWTAVDNYMREKHPKSALFADETALFLKSSPLLATAVQALYQQGKRREATELAWTEFEKVHQTQIEAEATTRATTKEEDLTARGQVRQEIVDNARKDAGVIQGSAGGTGVHENPSAAAGRAEELERIRNRMRVEGDGPGSDAAKKFRDLVIGPSLGFLRVNAPTVE